MLARWNAELIEDEGETRPPGIDQLEQRMRGWLRRGEYQAVIFEDEDEPVAYALVRIRDGEAYIRQFFVERSSRRRGLGRQAIDLLFHEIFPHIQRWRVSVLIDNGPAIDFWRSVGFADHAMQMGIGFDDR